MPLQFEPPADPLTGSETATSYVIESDALQRLTKEIERYGRRELAGRSVLIAGHRGVGKTTLVRKAIENARGSGSAYEGRPLFVDLHGPDLLAPPEKDTPTKPLIGAPANGKAANNSPADGKAAEKTPGTSGTDDRDGNVSATPEKSKENGAPLANESPAKSPPGTDLQSFVERLTFSLYRAAAKEFVDSVRGRRDLDSPGDSPGYHEISELAEQFVLELDGSTDLGRMRLLYERLNAFAGGVLGTSRRVTGSQELGLLAASSQAYRIISGKLDEGVKRGTSGKNTINWSIAADNLVSPATGVLAGSLVWAALPVDLGPLAKLFSSFATGLASAIAVKFTRTIQRESTQSTQVSFVPERDKLALRRLLPVLVDRFRDVGLPPIFVVDELDKVEDISMRMESLMGFLKQFVTERAFFCFLVDRDYYERLEATVSTHAFPKEATLFGDRLFVQYTPQAVHAYLRNVTKVGTPATGESQSDAARDLEVLPYVLLRRSHMHPFDLRREISKCTNAKNEFRFPPRALFNVQQYRNEVYYQVAVECVLAQEKLLDFAEDPNRAQLLYDALYFPIRTRKLPDEFDASRDAMKNHVTGRMGNGNADLLSDENLDILHAALRELIRFLCEPRTLLETMQSLAGAKHLQEPKVFPQGVVGVIDAAAGPKSPAAGSPLGGAAMTADPLAPPVEATPLLAVSSGDKYRWQFDRYGYPLTQPAPVDTKGVSPKTAEPHEVTSLLDEFDEAIRWLATKHGTAFDIELWERMRLIPTPPTWSYLEEAAAALRNPASLPTTKADEYNKALIGYRSNLQSALNAIWSGVAVAAMMAVQARNSNPGAQERNFLEMLAEVLKATSPRDQMLKQLEQIATLATSGVPFDTAAPRLTYLGMLTAIQQSANVVRKQPPKNVLEVNQQCSSFYESWFVEFYLGRSPQINVLWPFLGWAIGALPPGLRNINPLRMTIEEWNQVAILEPQKDRWSVIGLERLGFRRRAEQEALAMQPDDLIAAMSESIRKRGYERASVILQPSPQSLTQTWLPSENIACKIPKGVSNEDNPKYVLVEIADWATINKIKSNFPDLSPATRIAFFGAAPSPPNPPLSPYIESPLNLDDLVERLDARPASDWHPT
jgi:hypothetical protein